MTMFNNSAPLEVLYLAERQAMILQMLTNLIFAVLDEKLFRP